jgi:hypothetical protein
LERYSWVRINLVACLGSFHGNTFPSPPVPMEDLEIRQRLALLFCQLLSRGNRGRRGEWAWYPANAHPPSPHALAGQRAQFLAGLHPISLQDYGVCA